jgi:hypothetical protein
METKEETMLDFADKIPQQNRIKIHVKAKNLYNLIPSELNVDKFTYLEDSISRNKFGDSNHDFKTKVYNNQDMCWDISHNTQQSEDGIYTVRLDYLEHNQSSGNPNFFKEDRLMVQKGTIKGKISINPLKPPVVDDIYTIYLTITPPIGVAGGPQTFPVDPKLRILTSTIQ